MTAGESHHYASISSTVKWGHNLMSFSRRRPNQHATRGCPTGRLLTCPNHAPTHASDGQWKAQRGLCHVVLQGWRGQDPGDAARQQRPLRHERSTVGLIRSTPTQGGGWAVAPGRHPITSSSKPHARRPPLPVPVFTRRVDSLSSLSPVLRGRGPR